VSLRWWFDKQELKCECAHAERDRARAGTRFSLFKCLVV